MPKEFSAQEVERTARLLQRQVDKTFGRDSESDSRVEVILIDRTRFEPFHFEPILYRHKDKQGKDLQEGQRADEDVVDERLLMMRLNLGVAVRDLDLEMAIDLAHRSKLRFARTAAGRKLIAAHRKMEHKGGLGVRGCPVCDGVVE
jgi:hypothetical protein